MIMCVAWKGIFPENMHSALYWPVTEALFFFNLLCVLILQDAGSQPRLRWFNLHAAWKELLSILMALWSLSTQWRLSQSLPPWLWTTTHYVRNITQNVFGGWRQCHYVRNRNNSACILWWWQRVNLSYLTLRKLENKKERLNTACLGDLIRLLVYSDVHMMCDRTAQGQARWSKANRYLPDTNKSQVLIAHFNHQALFILPYLYCLTVAQGLDQSSCGWWDGQSISNAQSSVAPRLQQGDPHGWSAVQTGRYRYEKIQMKKNISRI